MKKIVFAILVMFLSLSVTAKSEVVSGTVKDAMGNPIAGVSVRELDNNRRIIHQTQTDQNGLFSFRVKDTNHYVQFSAKGYQRLTHKMLGYTLIHATLDERHVMPINKKGKTLMTTDKLLCGRAGDKSVPVGITMEQFNDTLFSFIIPVRVESEVDEYPAGRQLTVLGKGGEQLAQLENIVDAYPTTEDQVAPKDVVLMKGYGDVDNIPGQSVVKSKYFVYPHFAVSRRQLQSLMSQHEKIERILIDTFRGDNFWNYYLSDQAEEVDFNLP